MLSGKDARLKRTPSVQTLVGKNNVTIIKSFTDWAGALKWAANTESSMKANVCFTMIPMPREDDTDSSFKVRAWSLSAPTLIVESYFGL